MKFSGFLKLVRALAGKCGIGGQKLRWLRLGLWRPMTVLNNLKITPVADSIALFNTGIAR